MIVLCFVEFKLVQNGLYTDPDDQSNWFYYRWLLGRGKCNIFTLAFYMITRHHYFCDFIDFNIVLYYKLCALMF